MYKSGLFIFVFLFVNDLIAQKNPIELGNVHWLRDLKEAQVKSVESGKAIFILFQEIPGCATCQRYGNEVMKHSLIVDVVENEFIPLAIYNNKGGEDGRVLKLFKEPAWNNPVARIVDADLRDILPRLDGGYSPKQVTSYMINALKAQNKTIPNYLSLLQQSFTDNIKTITFGMYCFWEGESKLGSLDGVISTQPGFVNGNEVVKVNFDPNYLSPEKLISTANKQNCTSQIYAESSDVHTLQGINKNVKEISAFRPDQEPQYHLLHSKFRYVQMLPIQASRVNSALALGADATLFLSPTQLKGIINSFK